MKDSKKRISIEDWSKAIQDNPDIFLPKRNDPPITDGDLRAVTLTLDVVFQKAKIATRWDEFGNTLATRDGFVMIIHEQARIYEGQETTFLGTSVIHRDGDKEV